MQKFIWLWKHRHCWEQLKYLCSHRYELKRILSIVALADRSQEVKDILACLRDFDRVPLVRSWRASVPGSGKVEPPFEWPKRDMPRPKQDVSEPGKLH